MPKIMQKSFLYRDDIEVIDRIQNIAQAMNCSPIHVIRIAIRQYINKKKENEK